MTAFGREHLPSVPTEPKSTPADAARALDALYARVIDALSGAAVKGCSIAKVARLHHTRLDLTLATDTGALDIRLQPRDQLRSVRSRSRNLDLSVVQRDLDAGRRAVVQRVCDRVTALDAIEGVIPIENGSRFLSRLAATLAGEPPLVGAGESVDLLSFPGKPDGELRRTELSVLRHCLLRGIQVNWFTDNPISGYDEIALPKGLLNGCRLYPYWGRRVAPAAIAADVLAGSGSVLVSVGASEVLSNVLEASTRYPWIALLSSFQDTHEFSARRLSRTLTSPLYCFDQTSSPDGADAESPFERQLTCMREYFEQMFPADSFHFEPGYALADGQLYNPDFAPREDGFVFLSGGGTRRYDLIRPIAAALDHPFVIVAPEAAIEQYRMRDWGRHVLVLPPVGIADFAALVANAACVVNLSTNFGGHVLAHALYAGKPLVVGGAVQQGRLVHPYVDDGVEGFVVDMNGPERAATRIAEILRDGKLRAKMGRASAERGRTGVDTDRFVMRVFRTVCGSR